MLDQNTTILISNLVTATSTLIAVFLTNHRSSEGEKRRLKHEREQEELRIGHEREQEKLKRDNGVIENVYQTLVTVHDLFVQFAYDVRNPGNSTIDTVSKIKEISSTSQRTIMLIRLHLHSLKEDVKEYEDNITSFWNELGGFYASRSSPSSKFDVIRQERLLKAEIAYQESLANIQSKLEKLVR